MSKIVRVGITFPPELLKDFDEVVRRTGYGNRSKAVQDAVSIFVHEKKWQRDESGDQAGVLVMLYDHEVAGLGNILTNLQHHYSDIICSTTHIHLNEKECLETIAVKGSSNEIHELSNELTSKKGVKLLRAIVVPT